MPHCTGGHQEDHTESHSQGSDPKPAQGGNPSSGGSGFATMSGGKRRKNKSKGNN